MNVITSFTPNRVRTAREQSWDFAGFMKEQIRYNKRSEIIADVRMHLKRAQKFGYTLLVVEFATCLQHYYYMEALDRRIGKKYEDIVLYYSEMSHAETIVASKFSKIFYQLKKTRSPGNSLKKELREVCSELKPYLKYPSTDIWLATYNLCNILAYIEKKYELVIFQCHTAIDFFEANNIPRTAHFYKDMTPALIRMGRYEEARDAIKKAINDIPKGTGVWSTFLYYRVIIELHEGHYQRGYDIYKEAIKKKQIDKSVRETWLVVKAYFNFLIISGKLSGVNDFRIGKFLNNIEFFVSDKAGINCNVVIINTILRLNTDKGRGSIIDHAEAIEKYGERHLKPGSRGRLFIQMLLQIVPGNFNREEVEGRAAKYLGRMPEQEGYDGDLEVVPYEVLWGMVLEGLDK